MQDQTPNQRDREQDLAFFRGYSTDELRDGLSDPLGWNPYGRELASTVLDEREAGHPYVLSEEPLTDGARLDIAPASTEQADWEACNPASSAPVYPERFGTMTAVMLHSETLETLSFVLGVRCDLCIEHMEESTNPSYWIVQLWAIDRACRDLGVE
jgi:hypothetical protein